MRSALLLPLALFGFACDATIQEHAVLSGWNVTWDQLSHRVAYLETTLQPDTSLRLGAIGGNWSTGESFNDTPNYRVRYQWVETKAAHFVSKAYLNSLNILQDHAFIVSNCGARGIKTKNNKGSKQQKS